MKYAATTAVLLAGAASTTGFVVPSSMPVAQSSASTVMRLGGVSRGSSPFRGLGSSILKIFTASPAKRGGSSFGGNDGMQGGGGNKNGGAFGGMEEFDSEDADALAALASMGVLGGLWADYNAVLAEKPVLTKACTSLIGFSLGDTLAQKFVAKNAAFDYKRLARMAAFGFLFHGTISHFFYQKLEETIPAKDALGIAKKVFTDQVLWAPVFTFIYLTWMGVTDGLSPNAVGQKIKNDLVKGVVGSWSVWPVVHAIGFKFVPLEQRLLYINAIQIGYNVFLSVLGSNPGKVDNAATQTQVKAKQTARR